MGISHILVAVSSLTSPLETITDSFLIDSGAELSVLPASMWQRLGIKPVDTINICLADGSVAQRGIGYAFFRIDDRSAPSRVILGEPDDVKLLGVVVLEQLGFLLDPLKRKLMPTTIRM